MKTIKLSGLCILFLLLVSSIAIADNPDDFVEVEYKSKSFWSFLFGTQETVFTDKSIYKVGEVISAHFTDLRSTSPLGCGYIQSFDIIMIRSRDNKIIHYYNYIPTTSYPICKPLDVILKLSLPTTISNTLEAGDHYIKVVVYEKKTATDTINKKLVVTESSPTFKIAPYISNCGDLCTTWKLYKDDATRTIETKTCYVYSSTCLVSSSAVQYRTICKNGYIFSDGTDGIKTGQQTCTQKVALVCNSAGEDAPILDSSKSDTTKTVYSIKYWTMVENPLKTQCVKDYTGTTYLTKCKTGYIIEGTEKTEKKYYTVLNCVKPTIVPPPLPDTSGYNLIDNSCVFTDSNAQYSTKAKCEANIKISIEPQYSWIVNENNVCVTAETSEFAYSTYSECLKHVIPITCDAVGGCGGVLPPPTDPNLPQPPPIDKCPITEGSLFSIETSSGCQPITWVTVLLASLSAFIITIIIILLARRS